MMRYSADFHIHSKYSFNCSNFLTLSNIGRTADLKGIKLLGTGDIFHPEWRKELENGLVARGNGIFYSRDYQFNAGFIPSAEISTVFRRGDRSYKIHLVLMFPDFDSADCFAYILKGLGAKLESNGRPFVKADVRVIAGELNRRKSPFILFPAHIWTPWYSMLGAKSGFDSVEECFGEYTELVDCLETGLSSDEKMNRMCSFLDPYSLVSFSDAHSPERIGRNCTILEDGSSFSSVKKSMRAGTATLIDTWPETGKYYHDGHRKCGVKSVPGRYEGDLCPVCGQTITTGVLNRVMALADRSAEPETGSVKIVPLRELIAISKGVGIKTVKVQKIYDKIIESAGDELSCLLDYSTDLIKEIDERTGRMVEAVRAGRVKTITGFDGEYGRVDMEDF